MMQEKVITNIILKSGEKDASRGADYVRGAFRKYGVRSYATLVDHTSVAADLPDLPDHRSCGCYTFEMDKVGTIFAGSPVRLVSLNGPIPACDGWLVVSTERAAAVVLNHALMRTGNENQVITRLYGGQISSIDAYMDIFSGETETVVQINHYFDRKYRITFPMDVRYTIRSCDGAVRRSGLP